MIKSFDSLGEMFEYLEQQNAENRKAVEADLAINPWKLLTIPGDFVVFTAGENLLAVGQVEQVDDDEDARVLAANHAVLVNAWSPMCPEGELGSTPVANILGWVTEEFARAFQEKCREYPGDMRAYRDTVDMLWPCYVEHTRSTIKARMGSIQ